MIRLLCRVNLGRMHLLDVDGVDGGIVARPSFDKATLSAFMEELMRLSRQWPPLEPDAARRALRGLLPHFAGDPVSLGARLSDTVMLSASGYLVMPPVDVRDALGFVLNRMRNELSPAQVIELLRNEFGAGTPVPVNEADFALLLDELSCHLRDGKVYVGKAPAVELDNAGRGTVAPLVPKSPAESLLRMLEEAKGQRGFRMLVTPPERHQEIGPSVAEALKGEWISFEEAFFTRHADEMGMLERAERYAGQRDMLSEAAETVIFELLREHGEAGRVLVLGDTALLGCCDALDLPRRLYDETLSGQHGFWVLVVPGRYDEDYDRQPRFNEGPALWHLEGATWMLSEKLSPVGAQGKEQP